MNIIQGVIAQIIIGEIDIDGHDGINRDIDQETQPYINNHRFHQQILVATELQNQ